VCVCPQHVYGVCMCVCMCVCVCVCVCVCASVRVCLLTAIDEVIGTKNSNPTLVKTNRQTKPSAATCTCSWCAARLQDATTDRTRGGSAAGNNRQAPSRQATQMSRKHKSPERSVEQSYRPRSPTGRVRSPERHRARNPEQHRPHSPDRQRARSPDRQRDEGRRPGDRQGSARHGAQRPAERHSGAPMMRKSSSSESLQQNSDALHGQERMRTVR